MREYANCKNAIKLYRVVRKGLKPPPRDLAVSSGGDRRREDHLPDSVNFENTALRLLGAAKPGIMAMCVRPGHFCRK